VISVTCKHPCVWQDVFSHARKNLAALEVGDLLGTRKSWNFLKVIGMPRKKLKNEDDILSHNLIVRVNATQFNKLEKLRIESNCQTVAEIVRRILSGKKINCFYTDVSMNAPMEELVSIRKELKAIGININQITRTFNQEKASENNRNYYVLKVADLYKKVDQKVDRLLLLITKLTEKWLQG